MFTPLDCIDAGLVQAALDAPNAEERTRLEARRDGGQLILRMMQEEKGVLRAGLALETALTMLLFGAWPDGTHLLIDGHHRYVKAAMLGLSSVKGFVLSEEQWRPFLIEGLPDVDPQTLLATPSRIPA